MKDDLEIYEKYHKNGGTYEIPIEVFNDLLDEKVQLVLENQKYKEVINKAIKFIEFQRKNPQCDNIWRNWECDDLINILDKTHRT